MKSKNYPREKWLLKSLVGGLVTLLVSYLLYRITHSEPQAKAPVTPQKTNEQKMQEDAAILQKEKG